MDFEVQHYADVIYRKERSIGHKKFNFTDQTSIQHLQTFNMKKTACNVVVAYRYPRNDVLKRYFACTEVVLQKHMYRN